MVDFFTNVAVGDFFDKNLIDWGVVLHVLGVVNCRTPTEVCVLLAILKNILAK